MPPMQVFAPTTQDIAVVMCGGGDPFQEWNTLREIISSAGKNISIFAGNDMIELFPDHVDRAVTLHPEKLPTWLAKRQGQGFPAPRDVWAHRNYVGVTHWTKDWSGSTGLLCVKAARECGFTHIVTCGVHMLVESDHFVRKQPWSAAHGFRRGWMAHARELEKYVRSMGGWTQERFGSPTVEWLQEDIVDDHRRASNPEELKA